jgi:hypothetical protein
LKIRYCNICRKLLIDRTSKYLGDDKEAYQEKILLLLRYKISDIDILKRILASGLIFLSLKPWKSPTLGPNDSTACYLISFISKLARKDSVIPRDSLSPVCETVVEHLLSKEEELNYFLKKCSKLIADPLGTVQLERKEEILYFFQAILYSKAGRKAAKVRLAVYDDKGILANAQIFEVFLNTLRDFNGDRKHFILSKAI